MDALPIPDVINLWPFEAGHRVRALETLLEGGSGMQIVVGINVVQFSPDGQTLFSGSDDSEMRLWHALTRRPVLTRRHRSNAIPGMFSDEGTSLVTADIGQPVQIWCAPSREEIAAAQAKENG